MQRLLQYTSMKVSPCLFSVADFLMAPLFALVRRVYLNLPTLQPPYTPIQSQEAASEWPEGRKGAVSDHIIIPQRETHSVRLLYSRYHQCWVPFGKSPAGESADRQSVLAEWSDLVVGNLIAED